MTMTINRALLKKYDVAGPRYTSYPTAVQFSERFGEADYRWHVEHSNQDPVPKPLSIYVHIPFCQSLCYYCGCHKIITKNPGRVANYLADLQREISLQSALFERGREVRQIHLGGGTPTYADLTQLKHLLHCLGGHFDLSENLQASIEIDPRTTSKEGITELVDMGFNRMSFGVQDFSRAVQLAVNRLQDKDETLALLRQARTAGADSISIDLIYGLPKQTPQSFAETLAEVIQARPDRLALYNYAHMPALIKAQRLIREADLPGPEEKLAILAYSIETLTANGYRHIGMDHFASEGDSLSQSLAQGRLHRNFQGYSTDGDCDMIGLGASAIAKVGDSFSQNHKSLTAYSQCLAQGTLPVLRGYTLGSDDRIRAAVIQSIMCQGRIDCDAIESRFSIDFESYFPAELEALAPFEQDGLIERHGRAYTVSPEGRLFLRNLAMVFDVYLQRQKNLADGPKFSKVL